MPQPKKWKIEGEVNRVPVCSKISENLMAQMEKVMMDLDITARSTMVRHLIEVGLASINEKNSQTA